MIDATLQQILNELFAQSAARERALARAAELESRVSELERALDHATRLVPDDPKEPCP